MKRKQYSGNSGAALTNSLVRHAVAAEAFLKENLVGQVLPKNYQSILGPFVLESTVRPSAALEDLSFTLLKRKFPAAKVVLEPNGTETFPDLELSFSRDSKLFFEVKTKDSSGKSPYDIDLASLKQLFETTVTGDSRYWATWYLIWRYSETSTSFKVDDLTVGRLWEVAGRGEEKLRMRKSKGRSNSLWAGPTTCTSEKEFVTLVTATLQAEGSYTEAQLDNFSAKAKAILQKLAINEG